VRVVTALSLCLLNAAACAKASSDDDTDGNATPDAAVGSHDDAGGDTPDAGGGVVASSCPADQFATGFDESGALTCAPIDPAASGAVNQHCSIYLGWRDSCDGCTTAPAKWGATGASASSCANGAGADDTCTTPALGGTEIALFGLNTDGDVDDNDKFYLGWHCVPPDEPHVNGPCPAGTYLWAVAPAGVECVTASDMIAEYARTSCNLYVGSRDSCDGCVTAPAKWGHVSGADCSNDNGVNNTCTTPMLGGQTVDLFGLNTDGDVNDDDKLYMGFQCAGATAAEEVVDHACPDDQLVVGIGSDGRVHCASPLPAAEAVIQRSCRFYFGFRDSCDGCVTAPAKWGSVSHNECTLGVGADDTCTSALFDGVSVPLFGLNTDGDVDGNDKFYVGFQCE